MKSLSYFHLDRITDGWSDSATERVFKGDDGEIMRYSTRSTKGTTEEKIERIDNIEKQ